MASKNAALRVGMFVTGAIIGILALVFFLSGSVLHPGIRYETYFQESVQGLDVGTSVKFRGVTIGAITEIGLVTAEYPPGDGVEKNQKVYRQVVVRFQVDPRKIGAAVNIKQAIAHGLRVQIAPQGITGLAYLELTFVSPAQYPIQEVPWIPDSPVVPSIPSTLTQVQDAVTQILSSFSKVDLGKVVDQVSQLTAALDDEVTTGDAHQALAHANTLLGNLNTQMQAADLPGTTAAVRNLADGAQTRQIISQLNQTTQQLSKMSAQLPALISTSQATVAQASEATADLQAQMVPMLQNLKSATASLNALTQQLKSNPSQVLLGAQPPPEDEK
jgi:ABC-type transporter Mla subunit MlaD